MCACVVCVCVCVCGTLYWFSVFSTDLCFAVWVNGLLSVSFCVWWRFVCIWVCWVLLFSSCSFFVCYIALNFDIGFDFLYFCFCTFVFLFVLFQKNKVNSCTINNLFLPRLLHFMPHLPRPLHLRRDKWAQKLQWTQQQQLFLLLVLYQVCDLVFFLFIFDFLTKNSDKRMRGALFLFGNFWESLRFYERKNVMNATAAAVSAVSPLSGLWLSFKKKILKKSFLGSLILISFFF